MSTAVRFLVAMLLSGLALAASAGTQLVVPAQTSFSLTPGSSLAVQLGYNSTGPADNTLSGLSFRVHWDSRRLNFVSITGVLSNNLIAVTAPQVDDNDQDGDFNTDRFVLVEWNDAAGAWPGGSLPVSLLTANFTTASGFTAGATAVRFSSRITALDYDFASSPVVVTGVPAVDTVAPNISLFGDTITLIQGQSFQDPGASAFDDRDGNISNRIRVSGTVNTGIPGTYVLAYDVADLAGNNASTVTRNVVILPPDITPPVVTPPNDLSIEATGPNGASAQLIAGFLAAASAFDDRYGSLPVGNDAPQTFLPLGLNLITFTAVDNEGNVGTATATVFVGDSIGPEFSGAADVVVEAEGPDGTSASNPIIAAALALVTAVDLVDGVVSVGNDAPTLFPLGNTIVQFFASDLQENLSVTTLVVTVGDGEPPSLIVADDVSVEAVDGTGTPASDTTIAGLLTGATAIDTVDGTVIVSNDAPTQFPVGSTLVTFTATDLAGNSASVTRQVTVGDATPPVVTPPADVTVVETGGAGIDAGAAILQPFLNGATAVDAVDPFPSISNDAAEGFPVGSTTVTFTATDAAGNSGSATAVVTVLAAGAGDQDGDGMSDTFEATFGLDPNSPADADDDPDVDGFTNLQEFQNGTDPTVDSTIPVVTPPADVTVNAIGPLTPVTLGTATATDAKDGTLPVTLVAPRSSPLPPGRYVFVYRATDPAGNVGTAQQIVSVIPLIELSAPQTASEGQMVVVDVLLNGDAANYPVTVGYTVGGSAVAPGDHDLVAGTVTISSGRRGQIVFNTIADGQTEVSETIDLALINPTNAVGGPTSSSSVTILSLNVAPVVDIAVLQGATPGQRVLTTGGTVTATALVSDGNSGDTFTFDWSASDAAIPSMNGTTASTYTFNPNVTPGLYRLSVRVTDNGNASVTQTLLVEVMSAPPTLSAGNDSDGDGINDALEGFGDSDGDAVPDFQDPIDGGSLLPSIGANSSFLLAAEPGTDLVQGQTAFASDATGAQIALADITAHGGATGGTATTTDTTFAYDLPFYDFAIEGVAPGDSVSIVIPQSAALPAGTLIYRKFSPTTGFANFVVDANNAVRSAPGQLGVCPAVGSSAYVTGLTTGHFCVQLTIQDGSANDADRTVNGRIVDPGTVGRELPVLPPVQPGPQNTGSGGGGGGCAVGSGAGDPSLPLLLLAGLGYLLRRRFAG